MRPLDDLPLSHLPGAAAARKSDPAPAWEPPPAEPVRVWILGGLAACALGRLAIHLGARLAYEWSGAFTGDTPLYRAVGRGILNGLTPYRDLYETKPPGIFYLSALSQGLTGSFALEHGAEVAVLVASLFFLFRGATAGREKNGAGAFYYVYGMGLAAWCALLTLYIADRAGEVQPESFGAAFALGFLACVQGQKKLLGWRRYAAAGFLFLAGGFKEPFLLASLGGYLLLPEPRPTVSAGFVRPFLSAAILGMIFLVSTGTLVPYFSIYMPDMLAHRILESHSSLGARSFHWSAVYADLAAFSPALPGLLLFGLCGTLPAGFPNRKLLLRSVIERLVGIWLLVFCVGLGGVWWGHYFACAAPGFLAASAGTGRLLDRLGRAASVPRAAVAIWVGAVFVAALGLKDTNYFARKKDAQRYLAESRTRAAFIDRVLDACAISRYQFLGGNEPVQPFQYTRHSPAGPVFFQIDHFFNSQRTYFRREFLRSLPLAEVVVWDKLPFADDDLRHAVQSVVRTGFTTTPPPCAAEIPRSGTAPLTLYFRRDRKW